MEWGELEMIERILKGGMAGGGIGSFIGPVHRMAAALDGEAEYVAGAFSSDSAKSIESGKTAVSGPFTGISQL